MITKVYCHRESKGMYPVSLHVYTDDVLYDSFLLNQFDKRTEQKNYADELASLMGWQTEVQAETNGKHER